jgi:hypothetical protein
VEAFCGFVQPFPTKIAQQGNILNNWNCGKIERFVQNLTVKFAIFAVPKIRDAAH